MCGGDVVLTAGQTSHEYDSGITQPIFIYVLPFPAQRSVAVGLKWGVQGVRECGTYALTTMHTIRHADNNIFAPNICKPIPKLGGGDAGALAQVGLQG